MNLRAEFIVKYMCFNANKHATGGSKFFIDPSDKVKISECIFPCYFKIY